MTESHTMFFYILIGFAPSVMGLLGYMLRIERVLVKTKTDICWIKEELKKCRPS